LRRHLAVRIKITATTDRPASFPFNYQYPLQAAIYSLIRESSSDYSTFLHEQGYIKDGIDRVFKFFTFSKLKFSPKLRGKTGFDNVRQIEFIFSTIVEESLRHMILGIFSDREMHLRINGKGLKLTIVNVDVLEELVFSGKEKFICLSPIAVSTMIENHKGRRVPHFLNYMVPRERDRFAENIKNNLVNKYETLHNASYDNREHPFSFHFDPIYISKKNGTISKLISFKNDIKIKAMEAPFTVEADPDLIKIGYECGWGEKNSAGFGCTEPIRA
jgi:CRISPR-associated endoribonuclease Cas6